MNRLSRLLVYVTCAVLLLVPVVPVQADFVLTTDREASSVADPATQPVAPAPVETVDAAPSVQVGSFLSGEEWWEIPIGAAFMLAAGWAVYHFGWQND